MSSSSSSPFTLTYALRRMITTTATGAVGSEHPRHFPEIAFPSAVEDDRGEQQQQASHSSPALVPSSPVGEHGRGGGAHYRRTGGIAAWRAERKRAPSLDDKGDEAAAGLASARAGVYSSTTAAASAVAPQQRSNSSGSGGSNGSAASPVLGLREVLPPPQWLLGVTTSPTAPGPPTPREKIA